MHVYKCIYIFMLKKQAIGIVETKNLRMHLSRRFQY